MNVTFLSMFNADSPLSELLTIIPISGILIVFAMLVLLVLIISAFGSIMKAIDRAAQKKAEKAAADAAQEEQPQPTAAPAVQQDDDELIAVITAAVDAMYSGSKRKAVVRAVKPSAQGGRSAWAQAGVCDNIRAF